MIPHYLNVTRNGSKECYLSHRVSRTALMLQEAVYANTGVHVALLDVRKAFESVWINGMLLNLSN